jgi:hypothetical protein
MSMHPVDKSAVKRLVPTTPLNDAIKRMAEGDASAGSVIAMLNSQRPQNVMEYLHSLDEKRVYGHNIHHLFWDECHGNIEKFVAKLSE